jgi:hypothetical protein
MHVWQSAENVLRAMIGSMRRVQLEMLLYDRYQREPTCGGHNKTFF